MIKQAQDIKRNCEIDPWAKFMASESHKRHISEYRSVLHPVIYPPDVTVEFQTQKPSSRIFRQMDRWFWETASETARQNYLSTIHYLNSNIDPILTLGNNLRNGVGSHQSGYYML